MFMRVYVCVCDKGSERKGFWQRERERRGGEGEINGKMKGA